MDTFIRFGSDQACTVLNYLGSPLYRVTCLGLQNDAAFYQAGLIFWGVCGLVLFVAFYCFRKAIGFGFG